MLDRILDLFFPIECLCCERGGNFVCQECLQECIKPNKIFYCPACRKASPFGQTDKKCQIDTSLDGVCSAADFQSGLVRAAIKKLKYRNLKKLAQPLGQLLFLSYQKLFLLADPEPAFCLTYVPLHPKKERWRGYNQSRLLAEQLALLSGLACRPVLLKSKTTASQTKLSREARQQNVNDSFVADPQAEIANQSFIIVDDVLTTGATLNECARVLKNHGADVVWGLTVAKD